MNCTVTVYQDSQGRQVLVTRYEDGTEEVATRDEPFGSWGPPLSVVRTEGREARSGPPWQNVQQLISHWREMEQGPRRGEADTVNTLSLVRTEQYEVKS